MELRHVRYLLAVAEHGNFTRAAEDLHVSQPTLSQQIKQLERTMRVQLLDRTGRTVRLTDAGEAYVHYARRALQDLAAAERAVLDVQDLTRGGLRLAMTPTFTAYLIGPLVARFHTHHPAIVLDVREMTQDRIEAELLAGDLDLGIAFSGPHLPGIGATSLFAEDLSLVVSTGHPLADRAQSLPVSDLAECPLALLRGDFATRGHIDTYLTEHAVRPLISVEANSITALTEIVERTFLATVLPAAVTVDHRDLQVIHLDPPLPSRTVTLLRRESAYQSAAACAFTDLAHHWADANPTPENLAGEGAPQFDHRTDVDSVLPHPLRYPLGCACR
ncbi:transcriptional regulator CynR [Rhodococcus sp. H36-A4]|uniref:transcriptional regulator CynR n=1 Tax=Rhodococcus sp. H36-A4 TaxID=3004353 RepID=UPI0022AE7D8E|nr:transcriptional regulator CynR [Rhodococcus sp. H36-A4]MCZ4077238.1 transcriptional regulator CynR [Rhodococcus sp. H36-A4]